MIQRVCVVTESWHAHQRNSNRHFFSVSNCICILNCWCTVFGIIESSTAKVLTDILSKYYVQQGLNSEPVKSVWRQCCDVKFGCGSSAAVGGRGILLWNYYLCKKKWKIFNVHRLQNSGFIRIWYCFTYFIFSRMIYFEDKANKLHFITDKMMWQTWLFDILIHVGTDER